jgi:hypothetical protein
MIGIARILLPKFPTRKIWAFFAGGKWSMSSISKVHPTLRTSPAMAANVTGSTLEHRGLGCSMGSLQAAEGGKSGVNSELIRLSKQHCGRRFWYCCGCWRHDRLGHPAHAGRSRSPLRSSWLVVAVWLLGGVYAFFCTASVTELATMLPSPSPCHGSSVYQHL